MSATIEPNLALMYKEKFPNRCLFTKDWESLASDWSDRFRADANDIQVPLQPQQSAVVPMAWKAIFKNVELTNKQDDALEHMKAAYYELHAALATDSVILRKAKQVVEIAV
ncbi:hypothetical protein VTP01DRAFT_5934 [Rhizomucor pusillus]|uniref:uncharacterized protein n=1 Tax=Rhizomucor pusillus TaxID=4840 RepID=UPI00374261D4